MSFQLSFPVKARPIMFVVEDRDKCVIKIGRYLEGYVEFSDRGVGVFCDTDGHVPLHQLETLAVKD